MQQQVGPEFNPTQVTITGSTFQGNAADISAASSFPGGSAIGGALFTAGALTVSGTTFIANQAVGGLGGGFALGGAINYQGFSTFNLVEQPLLMNNKAASWRAPERVR